MAIGSTGTNCIPEAPDITVNNTTIDLTEADFICDEFELADSTGGAGLEFVLSGTPVDAKQILVIRNGAVGIEGTDYSIVDDTVTLVEALTTNEKLVVKALKVA